MDELLSNKLISEVDADIEFRFDALLRSIDDKFGRGSNPSTIYDLDLDRSWIAGRFGEGTISKYNKRGIVSTLKSHKDYQIDEIKREQVNKITELENRKNKLTAEKIKEQTEVYNKKAQDAIEIVNAKYDAAIEELDKLEVINRGGTYSPKGRANDTKWIEQVKKNIETKRQEFRDKLQEVEGKVLTRNGAISNYEIAQLSDLQKELQEMKGGKSYIPSNFNQIQLKQNGAHTKIKPVVASSMASKDDYGKAAIELLRQTNDDDLESIFDDLLKQRDAILSSNDKNIDNLFTSVDIETSRFKDKLVAGEKRLLKDHPIISVGISKERKNKNGSIDIDKQHLLLKEGTGEGNAIEMYNAIVNDELEATREEYAKLFGFVDNNGQALDSSVIEKNKKEALDFLKQVYKTQNLARSRRKNPISGVTPKYSGTKFADAKYIHDELAGSKLIGTNIEGFDVVLLNQMFEKIGLEVIKPYQELFNIVGNEKYASGYSEEVLSAIFNTYNEKAHMADWDSYYELLSGRQMMKDEKAVQTLLSSLTDEAETIFKNIYGTPTKANGVYTESFKGFHKQFVAYFADWVQSQKAIQENRTPSFKLTSNITPDKSLEKTKSSKGAFKNLQEMIPETHKKGFNGQALTDRIKLISGSYMPGWQGESLSNLTNKFYDWAQTNGFAIQPIVDVDAQGNAVVSFSVALQDDFLKNNNIFDDKNRSVNFTLPLPNNQGLLDVSNISSIPKMFMSLSRTQISDTNISQWAVAFSQAQKYLEELVKGDGSFIDSSKRIQGLITKIGQPSTVDYSGNLPMSQLIKDSQGVSVEQSTQEEMMKQLVTGELTSTIREILTNPRYKAAGEFLLNRGANKKGQTEFIDPNHIPDSLARSFREVFSVLINQGEEGLKKYIETRYEGEGSLLNSKDELTYQIATSPAFEQVLTDVLKFKALGMVYSENPLSPNAATSGTFLFKDVVGHALNNVTGLLGSEGKSKTYPSVRNTLIKTPQELYQSGLWSKDPFKDENAISGQLVQGMYLPEDIMRDLLAEQEAEGAIPADATEEMFLVSEQLQKDLKYFAPPRNAKVESSSEIDKDFFNYVKDVNGNALTAEDFKNGEWSGNGHMTTQDIRFSAQDTIPFGSIITKAWVGEDGSYNVSYYSVHDIWNGIKAVDKNTGGRGEFHVSEDTALGETLGKRVVRHLTNHKDYKDLFTEKELERIENTHLFRLAPSDKRLQELRTNDAYLNPMLLELFDRAGLNATKPDELKTNFEIAAQQMPQIKNLFKLGNGKLELRDEKSVFTPGATDREQGRVTEEQMRSYYNNVRFYETSDGTKLDSFYRDFADQVLGYSQEEIKKVMMFFMSNPAASSQYDFQASGGMVGEDGEPLKQSGRSAVYASYRYQKYFMEKLDDYTDLMLENGATREGVNKLKGKSHARFLGTTKDIARYNRINKASKHARDSYKYAPTADEQKGVSAIKLVWGPTSDPNAIDISQFNFDALKDENGDSITKLTKEDFLKTGLGQLMQQAKEKLSTTSESGRRKIKRIGSFDKTTGQNTAEAYLDIAGSNLSSEQKQALKDKGLGGSVLLAFSDLLGQGDNININEEDIASRALLQAVAQIIQGSYTGNSDNLRLDYQNDIQKMVQGQGAAYKKGFGSKQAASGNFRVEQANIKGLEGLSDIVTDKAILSYEDAIELYSSADESDPKERIAHATELLKQLEFKGEKNPELLQKLEEVRAIQKPTIEEEEKIKELDAEITRTFIDYYAGHYDRSLTGTTDRHPLLNRSNLNMSGFVVNKKDATQAKGTLLVSSWLAELLKGDFDGDMLQTVGMIYGDKEVMEALEAMSKVEHQVNMKAKSMYDNAKGGTANQTAADIFHKSVKVASDPTLNILQAHALKNGQAELGLTSYLRSQAGEYLDYFKTSDDYGKMSSDEQKELEEVYKLYMTWLGEVLEQNGISAKKMGSIFQKGGVYGASTLKYLTESVLGGKMSHSIWTEKDFERFAPDTDNSKIIRDVAALSLTNPELYSQLMEKGLIGENGFNPMDSGAFKLVSKVFGYAQANAKSGNLDNFMDERINEYLGVSNGSGTRSKRAHQRVSVQSALDRMYKNDLTSDQVDKEVASLSEVTGLSEEHVRAVMLMAEAEKYKGQVAENLASSENKASQAIKDTTSQVESQDEVIKQAGQDAKDTVKTFESFGEVLDDIAGKKISAKGFAVDEDQVDSTRDLIYQPGVHAGTRKAIQWTPSSLTAALFPHDNNQGMVPANNMRNVVVKDGVVTGKQVQRSDPEYEKYEDETFKRIREQAGASLRGTYIHGLFEALGSRAAEGKISTEDLLKGGKWKELLKQSNFNKDNDSYKALLNLYGGDEDELSSFLNIDETIFKGLQNLGKNNINFTGLGEKRLGVNLQDEDGNVFEYSTKLDAIMAQDNNLFAVDFKTYQGNNASLIQGLMESLALKVNFDTQVSQWLREQGKTDKDIASYRANLDKNYGKILSMIRSSKDNTISSLLQDVEIDKQYDPEQIIMALGIWAKKIEDPSILPAALTGDVSSNKIALTAATQGLLDSKGITQDQIGVATAYNALKEAEIEEMKARALFEANKDPLKMNKLAENAAKAKLQLEALWNVYNKITEQFGTNGNPLLDRVREKWNNDPTANNWNADFSIERWRKIEEAKWKNKEDIQRYGKSSYGSILTARQAELEKQQDKLTIKDGIHYVGEAPVSAEQYNSLLSERMKLADAYAQKEYNINAALKPQVSLLGNIGNSLKRRLDMMVSHSLGMKIINKITQAFKTLITTTTQLDAKLVNLQIAIGGTREETHNLLKEYSSIAGELGKTTQEVADAANSWYRSGYRGQEAIELTKASMQLSTLGAIQSADATKYLVSALKGWKLQASEVSEVVDKLVTIDMNAAISAGDLAEAMSRANNSARLAGVSMDTYIGYLTTVVDTSQKSAESVGQSFQTIFARMGNVKAGKFVASEADTSADDYSSDNFEALNDVEKVLNRVNIKVRETATEWRSVEDIIDEIATKWEGWDQTTKNAVSTAIAGTRQRENFVTLMENYDDVATYREIAEDSYGNAKTKMEAYTDSVEAAKNKITAATEKIALDLNKADVIKLVYNKIAEGLDNIQGILVASGLVLGLTKLGNGATLATNALTKLGSLFVSSGVKSYANSGLIATLTGTSGVVGTGTGLSNGFSNFFAQAEASYDKAIFDKYNAAIMARTAQLGANTQADIQNAFSTTNLISAQDQELITKMDSITVGATSNAQEWSALKTEAAKLNTDTQSILVQEMLNGMSSERLSSLAKVMGYEGEQIGETQKVIIALNLYRSTLNKASKANVDLVASSNNMKSQQGVSGGMLLGSGIANLAGMLLGGYGGSAISSKLGDSSGITGTIIGGMIGAKALGTLTKAGTTIGKAASSAGKTAYSTFSTAKAIGTATGVSALGHAASAGLAAGKAAATGMSAGPIVAAIAALGVLVAAGIKKIVDKKKQERIENAQKDFQEKSNTYTSSRSLLSVAEGFDELSAGVDRFGNNVSLTDEEYSQFLSYSNQLVETFPQLLSYTDAAGNNIAAMGDASESTAEKVKDLIRVNQKAADAALLQEDLFENALTTAQEEYLNQKNEYNSAQTTMSSLQETKDYISENINQKDIDALKSAKENRERTLKKYEEARSKYNLEGAEPYRQAFEEADRVYKEAYDNIITNEDAYNYFKSSYSNNDYIDQMTHYQKMMNYYENPAAAMAEGGLTADEISEAKSKSYSEWQDLYYGAQENADNIQSETVVKEEFEKYGKVDYDRAIKSAEKRRNLARVQMEAAQKSMDDYAKAIFRESSVYDALDEDVASSILNGLSGISMFDENENKLTEEQYKESVLNSAQQLQTLFMENPDMVQIAQGAVESETVGEARELRQTLLKGFKDAFGADNVEDLSDDQITILLHYGFKIEGGEIIDTQNASAQIEQLLRKNDGQVKIKQWGVNDMSEEQANLVYEWLNSGKINAQTNKKQIWNLLNTTLADTSGGLFGLLNYQQKLQTTSSNTTDNATALFESMREGENMGITDLDIYKEYQEAPEFTRQAISNSVAAIQEAFAKKEKDIISKATYDDIVDEAIEGISSSYKSAIIENRKQIAQYYAQEVFSSVESGDDKIINTWSELSDMVDHVTESFEALSEAQKEQAKNGQLSVATALQLIETNQKLIDSMSFDPYTGAIRMNVQEAENIMKEDFVAAEKANIQTMIDDAQNTIETYQTSIEGLKNSSSEESSKSLIQSYENTVYQAKRDLLFAENLYKQADLYDRDNPLLNNPNSNYGIYSSIQQYKGYYNKESSYATDVDNYLFDVANGRGAFADTSLGKLNTSGYDQQAVESARLAGERIRQGIEEGLNPTELNKLAKESAAELADTFAKESKEAQKEVAQSLASRYFEDVDTGDNGIIDTWSEYADMLTNVASSYDKLREAKKEDANTGRLSWETALDLLSTNGEFINAMDISADHISLKKNAEEEMAKAQIAAAQANIEAAIGEQEAEKAKLEAIVEAGVGGEAVIETANAEIRQNDILITSLNDVGLAYVNTANSAMALAAAQSEVSQATAAIKNGQTYIYDPSKVKTGTLTSTTTKSTASTEKIQVDEQTLQAAIDGLVRLGGQEGDTKWGYDASGNFVKVGTYATGEGSGTIGAERAFYNGMSGLVDNMYDQDYFKKNFQTPDDGGSKEDLLDAMLSALDKEYFQMKSYKDEGNKSIPSTDKFMNEQYYDQKTKILEMKKAEELKQASLYGEGTKEHYEYLEKARKTEVELRNVDDERVQDRIDILESAEASASLMRSEYENLLKTADTYEEQVEYQKKLNDAIMEELEMQKEIISLQKEKIELRMKYTTYGESGYTSLANQLVETAEEEYESAKEIYNTAWQQAYNDTISNGGTSAQATQAADSKTSSELSEVISTLEAVSDAYFTVYNNMIDSLDRQIDTLEKARPEEWTNTEQIESYYAKRRQYAQEENDKIMAILNNASEKAKYNDEQIEEMIDKYNDNLTNIISKVEELEDLISLDQERYSAITDTVNLYINDLQKQKEVMEDYYDTEIEKLQDKQTSIERTNKLIELQNNLLDAQQEKERVYKEGIGWTYSPNRQKQKDAQKALDDFNLQDNIDDLQNAKEAEADALQTSIDNWNDYLEMLEYQYQEYDRIENARTLRELLQVDTDEEVYTTMLNDQTSFVESREEAWNNHNVSMETIYGNYTSEFDSFLADYKQHNIDLATEKQKENAILNSINYTGGNTLSDDEITSGGESYDYDDIDNQWLSKYATDKQVEGANYGVGDSEGKWKTTSDGKKWYATSDDTYAAGGWYQIGSKWYYFDDEGYARNLSTGKYGQQAFSDEAQAESLNDVDSKYKSKYKYLFGLAGNNLTTTGKAINTNNGYQSWNGDSSYGTSNAWQKTDGKWWYGSSTQYAKDSWQNIGGRYYEFDSNGYLITDEAHGGENGLDAQQYQEIIKGNTTAESENTTASTENTTALKENTTQSITQMQALDNDTVQLTLSNGEVVTANGFTVDSNNNLVNSNGEVVAMDDLLVNADNELVASNGEKILSDVSVIASNTSTTEATASNTTATGTNTGAITANTSALNSATTSISSAIKACDNLTSEAKAAAAKAAYYASLAQNADNEEIDHGALEGNDKEYATGIENGPVTYTGLAMLHGTPSSPEYVLNSDQAYNLLRYMATSKFEYSKTTGTNSGTTYNLSGDIVLENCNDPAQFWSDVTKAMNNRFSVTRKS